MRERKTRGLESGVESEGRPEGGRRSGQSPFAFLLGLTLAALVLGIDLLLPLGVAGGLPYIVVVIVPSLWCPGRGFAVGLAVIATVLISLGFALSAPGAELSTALANRCMAVAAVWVAALLILQRRTAMDQQERALAEREEALKDLKILRGLIPICASCKQIRKDDGNWETLEAYLLEHSEAVFSHSLCLSCAENLYAELELSPCESGRDSPGSPAR